MDGGPKTPDPKLAGGRVGPPPPRDGERRGTTQTGSPKRDAGWNAPAPHSPALGRPRASALRFEPERLVALDVASRYREREPDEARARAPCPPPPPRRGGGASAAPSGAARRAALQSSLAPPHGARPHACNEAAFSSRGLRRAGCVSKARGRGAGTQRPARLPDPWRPTRRRRAGVAPERGARPPGSRPRPKRPDAEAQEGRHARLKPDPDTDTADSKKDPKAPRAERAEARQRETSHSHAGGRPGDPGAAREATARPPNAPPRHSSEKRTTRGPSHGSATSAAAARGPLDRHPGAARTLTQGPADAEHRGAGKPAAVCKATYK